MNAILNRIRREPALLVGAVLAIANLLGADADTQTSLANLVESLVVLAGAVLVRHRVTPTVAPRGKDGRRLVPYGPKVEG